MPAGRVSTSWKPGQSGNPRGRPKGARTRVRKAGDQTLSEEAKSITSLQIRELLAAVIVKHRTEAEETLAKCLRRPHHITRVLELFAKLNREIGAPSLVLSAGAGSGTQAVVIEWKIPEVRPAGALPAAGVREDDFFQTGGERGGDGAIGTWQIPARRGELVDELDGESR